MSGDSSGNKKIIIGVLVALTLCSACCCGGVAVFSSVGLIGASAAGIQALQRLEPVTRPVTKANAHPQIIDLLGTPIKQAPMLKSGNVNLKNDDGIADYSWVLNGPKGEGTLVVKAATLNGKWVYEVARVEVGEQSIDLMPME